MPTVALSIHSDWYGCTMKPHQGLESLNNGMDEGVQQDPRGENIRDIMAMF